MNAKQRAREWLKLMTHICGMPEPDEAMVELYTSVLLAWPEKVQNAVLRDATRQHQFGNRLPLPSELQAIADNSVRTEQAVYAPIYADSDREMTLQILPFLIDALKGKVSIDAVRQVIDRFPERHHKCAKCLDSGLVQIWSMLRDYPDEYHITQGKQTITQQRTPRIPNSPVWEFPYPVLVEAPDPGAARMVAGCPCRSGRTGIPATPITPETALLEAEI